MSEQAEHRTSSWRQARWLRSGSRLSLVATFGLAAAPGLTQTASALRATAGLANPAAAAIPARVLPVAPSAAAMVSASARAIASQARVANATSLAVQANAAARAAAAALPQSVANGLVIGGLVPVANPTSAALDPTGLRTWQGAAQPVQSGTAAVPVVTITQTQSRALLSWSSFNIGRDTTLAFEQHPDWVVLNRIVANIDPLTGQLADPAALAPSRILGKITGAGTVLVLNQNGILFGPTAQVNTHSFLASSLEIGARSKIVATSGGNVTVPTTLGDRSISFLQSGLLLSGELLSSLTVVDRSSVADGPNVEGAVRIDAGAAISSDKGGYVIIAAPVIANAGQLTSAEGQVSLQSGRQITARASSGASDSIDPTVRGLILVSASNAGVDSVSNAATGIIAAPRGYVSLGGTFASQIDSAGILSSTTSVARNGKIVLTGATVTLGSGAVLAITPDTGTDTIPQGADSVAAFRHSAIEIGGAENSDGVAPSVIAIGGGTTIYAPSGNVAIGGTPSTAAVDGNAGSRALASSVVVDSGAVIDVGGIKDFVVPASRNSIRISPVKRNELRDTPNYRDVTTDGSFTLNGTTLFVDPRLSGVRADGVAWVGSPLIEAASYYAQIGVTAAELMTGGGTLTLGTRFYNQGSTVPPAAVIVRPGATLDVSGGWVSYQAGVVRTSRLLTADGRIVDIARADPNDSFVAVVEPDTATQPRFGASQSFANPSFQGFGFEPGYTEGRDAGVLTIKASTNQLGGTLYGDAFAGTQQLANARRGTANATVAGDVRPLQASPAELPSGGLLKIQALGGIGGGGTSVAGGADILVYHGSASAAAASEILLADNYLSGSGFAALALQTSGGVTLAAGTALALAPGGGLTIDAGRSIRLDGSVDAPSGTIAARTYEIAGGSVFRTDDDLPLFIAESDPTPRLFDITVNGRLSARGRFVNDALVTDGAYLGAAYTDGGSISLTVAPRVLIGIGIGSATAPDVAADLSGSLFVNAGASLDVRGGGYVKPDGTLVLGGNGGNVSLINQTTYFQVAADSFNLTPQFSGIGVNLPSFRVSPEFGRASAAAPRALESTVVIAPGTIAAQGFQGGGSFTLVTPELNFGAATGATGTVVPLTFIAETGFSSYSFTTFKTRLEGNVFSNGAPGGTALLDTQIVRIGAGQTLDLNRSRLNALLSDEQIAAVRGLATGGDIVALTGAGVPADAWDRRGVSLAFGGLTELQVDAGGSITGSDGSALTASKLLNTGTIRLPGGTVRQTLSLPVAYLDPGRAALGVADLGTVFGMRDADGRFDETSLNLLGITGSSSSTVVLRNGDLAGLGGASRIIYYTGALAADEGIRLAAGSTLDLSGASIRNPRAGFVPGTTTQKIAGRLTGGGSLIADASFIGAGVTLIAPPGYGTARYVEPFTGSPITVRRAGNALNALAGATLDLGGAADVYDQEVALGVFAPGAVWSDGGRLTLGAGGSLGGAAIRARGGAAAAQGGVLTWLDPVLAQHDAAAAARNTIAADQIMTAGFATFVAQDRLTTLGDVTLTLARGFYLTARPYNGDANNLGIYRAALAATGNLEIAAPYIRLESPQQTVLPTRATGPETGTIVLRGGTADVVGSVYFEPSLTRVAFDLGGDFRVTGAQPPILTLAPGVSVLPVASSLGGQLVATGDLTIRAAQVYPTTGTGSLQQQIDAERAGGSATPAPYLIASTGSDATVRFERATTADPAAPWSAGGNLLVQAAHVEQAGVLRVPVGRLQLGGNTTLTLGNSLVSASVPATATVALEAGSLTSLSANGLSIPYGTTTDLIEYFFTPTSDSRLFAPPAAELRLAAASVVVDGVIAGTGARVDASGGGDLYAYEFVAGVGGSRDVLSRTASDAFSSNNGLQYADGRQVYAIVPSLQTAAIAPFDPIYSSDYAALYRSSDAGKRVYLEAAPGLTAGWYTLLPARYALLPGGMRVVENSGNAPPASGISATLKDGSIVVGGRYGVSGTAIAESQRRSFTVMSQATLRKYSQIELTSATYTFDRLAKRDGLAVPRLPRDAARLVLTPLSELSIGSPFLTAPASGGRGAQVDIAGNAFQIVAPGTAAGSDGVITLTTTDFSNLNAASLLIGGVRTDRADGTTNLEATTQSIRIANDAAHPLAAPEIVLVVDGLDSRIAIDDGAVIAATGTLNDTRTGRYIITANDTAPVPQTGNGIVRVANGPERLIARPGELALANSLQPTSTEIGAATLTGTSILLDSSRDLVIGATGTPAIDATYLAIGGDDVFFTAAPSGFRGLTITPELQAQFARSQRLTITTKSIVGFAGGSYAFNDLVLDARGVRPYGHAVHTIDPGLLPQTDVLLADPAAPIAVTLAARELTFANSDRDRGPCADGNDVNACGSTGNSLIVNASVLRFASGPFHSDGFDRSVQLNATAGAYAEGSGFFDAGIAALGIAAPFIGDRAPVADPRAQRLQPSLALLTTGDVVLTNPGAGVAGTVTAAPGASLSIGSGEAPVRSVSIDGVTLRATAGRLDIRATGTIRATGGAVLAAPGYAKRFGDAADAVTVAAPGGGVTLVSLAGDIDLGPAATLSVGGGSGNAGTLILSAARGAIRLPGTIDAAAPGGKASLRLDMGRNPFVTGSSGARLFELSPFLAGNGAAFGGDVRIRTGEGDLTLDAGQTLRAAAVRLTADGGRVMVAGRVDTSGIGGGDIGLYGTGGVTLAATATLDAHADGYPNSDTRAAHGGAVELGTAAGGDIVVAAGAAIDVAARRPGARLIAVTRKDPLTLNDTAGYEYAAGDEGGTLLLRAPLVGGDSVDIAFAGSVTGAREVSVEGYRVFDLKTLAGAADCSAAADICINAAGQAVLDLNAVPLTNRLATDRDGSVVRFVRGFNLAGAAGLGALQGGANYHARPGIELAYDGDIVLASNWNLGAGIVDEKAAAAAGLLKPSDALGHGLSYIVPGKEAEIYNRYTDFLYRVGGRADGAAGVLTLRAGHDLDIKGSITDGFFTFADQTEPNYLSYQLGGGDRRYHPALSVVCGTFASTAFSCGSLGTPFLKFPDRKAVPYAASDIVTISVGTLALGQDLQFADGASPAAAPYSAAANAPGARGLQAQGAGDPIGSAVLAPLRPDGSAADSFSLRLVAGAAPAAADPLQTAAAATGSVRVSGEVDYRAAPIKGVSSYAGALQLFNYGYPGSIVFDQATVTAPADFINAIDGVDGSFYTRLNFGTNPALAAYFRDRSRRYIADNGVAASDYQYFGGTPAAPTILTARLDVITGFLDAISSDFGARVAAGQFGFGAPTARAATPLDNPNLHARTLIRTGTGSIDIAAAGDVDLRSGDRIMFRSVTDRDVSPGNPSGAQVGGSAVYTAGHRVTPGTTLVVDRATGTTLAVDPSAFAPPAVKAGFTPNLQSVLLTEPVYAGGGGSIAVSAGRDVLARRDAWSESFRAESTRGSTLRGEYTGASTQLWRTGNVGAGDLAQIADSITNIRINPQLFSTGLGALGGGDIAVDAGRDVAELTVAVDTSITTATIGGTAARSLVSYGGGDIALRIGGDLRGGQIDVASGRATVAVGGDIASSGLLRLAGSVDQPIAPREPDRLRLRVSDATASLTATGSVELAAIAALGVRERTPLNGAGFYTARAGVSVVGNGAVTLDSRGKDIETGFSRDIGSVANTTGILLPGSLSVAALAGDIDLAGPIVLFPSATGQLALFSGGDIAPLTLAMDDGDPSLAPGALSAYGQDTAGTRAYGFAAILPTTDDARRRLLHNERPTHAGDATPAYVFADGNIDRLTLALPKAARIRAGGDISDLIFAGQHLGNGDVTRITAGRDIVASSRVLPVANGAGTANLPVLQGNSIVLGGPGALFVEAGRDLGPFLNSATVRPNGSNVSYAGGIITVGNDYNPWLGSAGAKIYALFGVAGGGDYDALRDYYVDPARVAALDGDLFEQVADANGNKFPDRSKPIYAKILIDWMTERTGTAYADAAAAYAAFTALPPLVQRQFLLDRVYFNELAAPSRPDGPSYLQYIRGYRAVDTLFPATLGYTANDLGGASNGGVKVPTGNLDLRLAALESQRGGDVTILGPGGRVLGGSVVATAAQAARRGQPVAGNNNLFLGNRQAASDPSAAARIFAIPTGFEGVLTLRGGAVRGFTDGDFLLNQARLFTVNGGDVTLWSSNGNLNAGQGAKTSASNPPVVVRFDPNAFSIVDQAGSVTGAGIAALRPNDGGVPSNVTLIAPVGTVDAGDAGVRASGNVFVAAAQVANADNFSAGDTVIGVPGGATVDVSAAAAANATSAAAAQAAAAVNPATGRGPGERNRITVEVLGFGGDTDDDPCNRTDSSRPPNCPRPIP